MRMEVRVHGSGVSDELRTIVYHETERLAQALRRRINTIRVDLREVPGSNQGGHHARCQVDVLFDDGSSVVQVDEELSRQPDSLPLWNQRVALLLDLERLYTDNLRREYHRMASL